jgi:uncharacterized protein (TIGR02300 family)
MTTASEFSKAMRGTKRVCPACEARFYDLAREAIACPSCGAPYSPAPVADAGVRTASLAGKAGWRGRIVRPLRSTPETDAKRAVSPEVAAEEGAESVTEIDADNDLVLEQEPEDGDVSGLVDHEVDEPKEP